MSNEYFYKEFPKTCAPDDFWGQVRRTVNGRPVDDHQIRMIVDAVSSGLELVQSEILLDLCCGNGALTTQIIARCRAGVGVDFSEVLIKVARSNFSKPDHEEYVLEDVNRFVAQYPDPGRFHKAMCYGSFQYLPEAEAQSVLGTLRDRFRSLRRVFIGNLPDLDRIGRFFRDAPMPEGIEIDPGSPVGIWRSQEQFARLARTCGWSVEFRQMPADYYAAHYRYDAVLTPGNHSA
ncbi:MAG: class I SAM-dependent methyltransferase [Gammaproteobacteria bacterium]|nr:class I SAM-dependent methyltransferase [Gammaproteobacteria bacterium]